MANGNSGKFYGFTWPVVTELAVSVFILVALFMIHWDLEKAVHDRASIIEMLRQNNSEISVIKEKAEITPVKRWNKDKGASTRAVDSGSSYDDEK